MGVHKNLTTPIETLWPLHSRERPLAFKRKEWMRFAGLYGVVAFLQVCGWGLFLYFSSRYRALVGLGFVAYMFGLRHAFDADQHGAVHAAEGRACR